MESGVRVANSVPSSPVLHTIPERTQVLSPTRLAKLPPITASTDEHPSAAYLQLANAELKESMRNLLVEAQSAESRIQRGIEVLWQRMMEMLDRETQEMKQQLANVTEELSTTCEKLACVSAKEAALVQQNVKMSLEIVEGEKKQKKLQTDLNSLRAQLASKETELEGTKEELHSVMSKHKSDVATLQQDLEEKTKRLKEYQDKISKMTDKAQKLAKQLASEKTNSEQLQKSTANQASHQTSENRKMALEISKLKSQLASSSSNLATTKEELKRLELQLKNAQQTSETTIASIHKQHTSVVQVLERKISDLEEELELLRLQHHTEIESLKEQLHKAQVAAVESQDEDGYLNARIRFLQHQNRQEKMKLSKERQQSNP